MATYNPSSVALIIAGVIVEGYADGTFIKVKRNKDLYSQKVGAYGDVVKVRSADKSGTLSVTLLATSNTNDFLSALLLADEAASNGTTEVPLMLKDNNGNTIIAGNGHIKGWPEVDISVDVPNREWTLNMSCLQIFIGGN